MKKTTISKQYIAVKAVIQKKGKFLLVRESKKYTGGVHKGMYGFMGGKVNIGESFSDALHREVKKELGITIKIGAPFFVSEWRPTIQGQQIQIIGIFFLCDLVSTNFILSPEYDEYVFVTPTEAKKLPLIEESIEVINLLASRL